MKAEATMALKISISSSSDSSLPDFYFDKLCLTFIGKS